MTAVARYRGRAPLGVVAAERLALPVPEIRRLEGQLMAAVPSGTLMQRAATALDVECARLLRDGTGSVAGRRVVLLVGAGDNGGDALYAGARLARRGVAVTALLVGARHHEAGGAALRAAGGTVRQVDPAAAEGVTIRADGKTWDGRYPLPVERDLVARADLVVDGILGIGGRGALTGVAAMLAHDCWDKKTVAVDLPSGVDPATGVVAGPAVRADRTVAMGVLKPGLLLGEGRVRAGEVVVVDIGLALADAADEGLLLMDDARAAGDLARPVAGDDKYTRGVVGVSAGSAKYPGAAVLCTGSARHAGAGYVRYAGPAAAEVVRRWPDVVATDGRIAGAGRVQCWVVGSGRGTDDGAARAVLDALGCDVPVVLDADALTVLAEHSEVRAAVRARRWPTVLTPHAGEFARLGGGDTVTDRAGAVRALADELGAVVLLKGATTLVAAAGSGGVHAVTSGPPELATAGSGDVLSGIIGAMLAHRAASERRREEQIGRDLAATCAAAAAHVHGVAGQVAARGGRSVAALDVLGAVPEAVATVRRCADAP